jgi:ferredoxin
VAATIKELTACAEPVGLGVAIILQVETRWTITVDRDRCVGSGLCVVYAPGTFSHDDEAKAVVVDLAGDTADLIRTAAEVCPADAIKVVSNEGG